MPNIPKPSIYDHIHIFKRIRLKHIEDETLEELTNFCNELDFSTFPEAERFVLGKYKTLYGISKILEKIKQENMEKQMKKAERIILRSASLTTHIQRFGHRVKRGTHRAYLFTKRKLEPDEQSREQTEKKMRELRIEALEDRLEQLKEKYDKKYEKREQIMWEIIGAYSELGMLKEDREGISMEFAKWMESRSNIFIHTITKHKDEIQISKELSSFMRDTSDSIAKINSIYSKDTIIKMFRIFEEPKIIQGAVEYYVDHDDINSILNMLQFIADKKDISKREASVIYDSIEDKLEHINYSNDTILQDTIKLRELLLYQFNILDNNAKELVKLYIKSNSLNLIIKLLDHLEKKGVSEDKLNSVLKIMRDEADKLWEEGNSDKAIEIYRALFSKYRYINDGVRLIGLLDAKDYKYIISLLKEIKEMNPPKDIIERMKESVKRKSDELFYSDPYQSIELKKAIFNIFEDKQSKIESDILSSAMTGKITKEMLIELNQLNTSAVPKLKLMLGQMADKLIKEGKLDSAANIRMALFKTFDDISDGMSTILIFSRLGNIGRSMQIFDKIKNKLNPEQLSSLEHQLQDLANEFRYKLNHFNETNIREFLFFYVSTTMENAKDLLISSKSYAEDIVKRLSEKELNQLFNELINQKKYVSASALMVSMFHKFRNIDYAERAIQLCAKVGDIYSINSILSLMKKYGITIDTIWLKNVLTTVSIELKKEGKFGESAKLKHALFDMFGDIKDAEEAIELYTYSSLQNKNYSIARILQQIHNSHIPEEQINHIRNILEKYFKQTKTLQIGNIISLKELDIIFNISGDAQYFNYYKHMVASFVQQNIDLYKEQSDPKTLYYFVSILGVNIPEPSNILEYMINNGMGGYVSEISDLYPVKFQDFFSKKMTNISNETIEALQGILPRITPYERLGLIKLVTIKPEDVPKNIEEYYSLLENKSKQFGVHILSINTLLLLENASKEQIESLRSTHPLLYDEALTSQRVVSDTTLPLNMQTASEEARKRYHQLRYISIGKEQRMDIGVGLSLAYRIVGETAFLQMTDEELKTTGEFLTHLGVDKKEASRFDAKPLLISYILRRSNFETAKVSEGMNLFLEGSHGFFTYHGTIAFKGSFEYRGLPLFHKATPGFYTGDYNTARGYGNNVHILTNFLSSTIGIVPSYESYPSQRADDIYKIEHPTNAYIRRTDERFLIDVFGGLTSMPHNFLIQISNSSQTYALMRKFNELARKTESELKEESLNTYNVDAQTFDRISKLYSRMLKLGYSEAISLDLAYSLLEGQTQFLDIFRSIGERPTPRDISYLVSFYVIRNEFSQKENILIHKFPTYVFYGNNAKEKRIRLYYSGDIKINEIENIKTARQFLDDMYMETYRHYTSNLSEHLRVLTSHMEVEKPNNVFERVWQNIRKVNGTYVDKVAEESGKHKPFIDSNAPLASGSAGRHEMVPGSSDFELGSVIIEGKSSEAVDAASSKIKELGIEEASAVHISYNPETGEIQYSNEPYMYAEAFDAVPLIDKNDPQQREEAANFRIALLNKITHDDDVLDALETDLTGRKHFIERTMGVPIKISDMSSQSAFKHTLYKFSTLVPKVMFIMYYRTNPKFREYIQERIREDPMIPLFSYGVVEEWMREATGNRRFAAPLYLGKVILTSRALMYQFWTGINAELGTDVSLVSPIYIGWLIPPNWQSALNVLTKRAIEQYSEIASAYIPDIATETPEVLEVK